MKRIYTGLMAASLVLFSGCGADKADAAFTGTIEEGVLTACTDVPYEPFEFGDPGAEKGIDIDLIKAIAGELGLTAKFVDTDFDSILDAVDDRKCDVVASSLSITDERKQKYLFSDGYFEVNQSLMVRTADASKYSTLSALGGKKVGVQKGTTGADYANSHLKSDEVVEYEAADEITAALEENKIDGVVQDFPVNSYLSQKTGKYKVVNTFTDVAREQYGFAMTQSSNDLQVAINKALGDIRKDGRYDEILRTYLGTATK